MNERITPCPFCETENILRTEETYAWGEARSYSCKKCGYFTIIRNRTLYEGFKSTAPPRYMCKGTKEGLRIYGEEELLALGI